MTLPNAPVTLSVEQIAEFNHKLSEFRHGLNNNLSLITAAIELMRRRPETAPQMSETISEQPRKIVAAISEFSGELEKLLGITRP